MIRRLKRRIVPSMPERDKFVEAGEAMRVTMRAQTGGLRLPLPEFRGFVNTDHGLATMSRACPRTRMEPPRGPSGPRRDPLTR